MRSNACNTVSVTSNSSCLGQRYVLPSRKPGSICSEIDLQIGHIATHCSLCTGGTPAASAPIWPLKPQRPQSSSASRLTAGAFGFLTFTQFRSTQQRWKDRRGLSPFCCCAILVLLPTNSAKTVTDSLPASLIQSIRTLLSVEVYFVILNTLAGL